MLKHSDSNIDLTYHTLSSSKLVRSNPEIVISGVGTDATGDEIIEALKSQSAALDNADISLKKFFEGNEGRNMVFSKDLESYQRLD